MNLEKIRELSEKQQRFAAEHEPECAQCGVDAAYLAAQVPCLLREIERLNGAVKAFRAETEAPTPETGPFLICPGTKPCCGSGVSREPRACPNCGEQCVPYPTGDAS